MTIILLSISGLAGYDPNCFDPENAAHGYRKAYALYEEPNAINLRDYAYCESTLTPEIERHLKKQQSVIKLVIQASAIERCDWQFDPFIKTSEERMHHLTQAKNISWLLLANARYQQDKGLSKSPFDTYNSLLQFAAHLDADSHFDHMIALSLRTMTFEAIHQYLNHHPEAHPAELHAVQSLLNNEANRNKITCKDTVARSIEKTREILTNYKQYLYDDHFLTKQIGIPAEQLSGDFYTRNLQFYNDYMNKYLSYHSLPYPEACRKITDLGENLKTKGRIYFMEYRDRLRTKITEYESEVLSKLSTHELDPVSLPNMEPRFLAEIEVDYLEKCDFLYSLFCVPNSATMFSIETRICTQFNALTAGIQLLVRYRDTKTIPEKLPADSPHDLFSDKPFLVIKTTEGFKLKCQGNDLSSKKVHEYEFILPKNNTFQGS